MKRNCLKLLGMSVGACLIFMAAFLFWRSYPPTSSQLVDFPMSNCLKPIQTQEELERESAEIFKKSQETAKLYEMQPGQILQEITQKVLNHPNTSLQVKKAISEQNHRYYIFSYPSDGLAIKGYISLPTPTSDPLPLIILLRGGNRIFGLPYPGELSTQKGYSVVVTTNRGGVSEGEDEFGGNDVNDVKNLMAFLPTLEEKLQVRFHPTNKYMVGVSRGGMQLFLALGRYPEIQRQVKKVASISGLLNIVIAIEDRPSFKAMLQDFGLTEDENGKAWLAWRQPINYVQKISKQLPILIAQGTQDNRVCLKEGYDMLQALHDEGHTVTYVEIEGGDHVLQNTPDFIPFLIQWFETSL